MTKQSSHKKILSILSLVVALLFVGYYFLYKDIKTKNQKISYLENEISLQSGRQEYLVSTEKLIESLSADISDIDTSIVAKDADVNFIENLEAIAKNNNLSIDIDSLGIEDLPGQKSNDISTLKVRARATGPWKGTYAFFAELESLPFKVKINKYSLSNVSSDTGVDAKKVGQIWQSTFEIVVLKYK